MSTVEVRTYRGRVLWGPFVAVNEAQLEQLEQTVGRRLPAGYREFVALANGGTLPYAVRLPPKDPDGELLEFSTITRVDGDFDIAAAWKNFENTDFAEHLPQGLMEVAQDGGGSTLFIDLGEESFGSVWAFVWGLPSWAGSGRSTMGGQVAPSWNDYLDMLTLDEDYAREVWEEAQINPDPDWTNAVVTWLDSGLRDWRTTSWGQA